MRLLLLALLMTVVGVLLTGCDRAQAHHGAGDAVARTSHARAEAKRRAPSATSLRSLLHARAEAHAEALYEEDDDDDDDLGLAAPSPQAPDDDAAPGFEDLATTSVSLPVLARCAPPSSCGLGPSSGHARSTEPPPRA